MIMKKKIRNVILFSDHLSHDHKETYIATVEVEFEVKVVGLVLKKVIISK